MSRSVKLIGLDFGTTTSSAVGATAELAHNAVTGRSELSQLRECYRSEMVFTPVRGESLDLERLNEHLDEWLGGGGVQREEIFGGGALLTGLTAKKANAAGLVRLVERRLGDALIAAADDPCFESWLAFMGSCAGLSREHSDTPIINLDIGGGTTNIALGCNGDVLRTGCLFVGARHIQVEPGTYRIVTLSNYATRLLEELDIAKAAGDSLRPEEVQRILDFYLTLLEAAVSGNQGAFETPLARVHQQVAFRWPAETANRSIATSHQKHPSPLPLSPRRQGRAVGGEGCSREHVILTLSGGVGELVYSHLRGRPWPATTFYGDLGIDLARRLVGAPAWAEHLRTYMPASGGRATVYGLLRHSTQVSGNTLFLANPDVLPLRNLPIFGSISPTSTDDEIRDFLDIIRRSAAGGSLQVKLAAGGESSVRELGKRLAGVLTATGFPAQHPLVLLVDHNLGKVLGHCVTNWGRLSCNVVVIDEITIRNAQFIQLGRLQNQVVPVSFHGMNEAGDAS